MTTHSKDGREWAKLSELKPGMSIRADGDFTCGIANRTLIVGADIEGRLFVNCNGGHDGEPTGRPARHYLDGQLQGEDHDHLIGFWRE